MSWVKHIYKGHEFYRQQGEDSSITLQKPAGISEIPEKVVADDASWFAQRCPGLWKKHTLEERFFFRKKGDDSSITLTDPGCVKVVTQDPKYLVQYRLGTLNEAAWFELRFPKPVLHVPLPSFTPPPAPSISASSLKVMSWNMQYNGDRKLMPAGVASAMNLGCSIIATQESSPFHFKDRNDPKQRVARDRFKPLNAKGWENVFFGTGMVDKAPNDPSPEWQQSDSAAVWWDPEKWIADPKFPIVWGGFRPVAEGCEDEQHQKRYKCWRQKRLTWMCWRSYQTEAGIADRCGNVHSRTAPCVWH
jgi:hypothetical protein